MSKQSNTFIIPSHQTQTEYNQNNVRLYENSDMVCAEVNGRIYVLEDCKFLYYYDPIIMKYILRDTPIYYKNNICVDNDTNTKITKITKITNMAQLNNIKQH